MSHFKRGAKGRRTNALSQTEVITDLQIMLTGIQYNFECHRCGACCVYSHPIGIDESDLARMAKALKLVVQEFKERYVTVSKEITSTGDEVIDSLCPEEHYVLKDDLPCPFYDFDDRACKIYEARPVICRLFPFVNLRMIDIDWKAKTVTLKCTRTCPATGNALKYFESKIAQLDEVMGDGIPTWTVEEAQRERSIVMEMFVRALVNGLEDCIRLDFFGEPRPTPQKAAMIAAYTAYLRLRKGGWQCRFDYREAEIRQALDIVAGVLGVDPIGEVKNRQVSANRYLGAKQEVVSHAV